MTHIEKEISNQKFYGTTSDVSLASDLNPSESDSQRNCYAINGPPKSNFLGERIKLLYNNPKPETEWKPRTSLVRFYILLLFCAFTFMQCVIWNTWAPIADSAELVYKWDRGGSTIALLSNWGSIAFIPGILLFPAVIKKLGLRYGVLIAMALTFAGAALRIFTTAYPVATVLMHIAHFLNGLAGPIAMGGSTTISANWFPYNQRTLATGIGGSSLSLGVATSFIIGPLMVRQVNETVGNNRTANISSAVVSEVRTDILHMLYVQAGICGLLFLLILIYYPSRPKHPPSVTAEEKRSNFRDTLFLLIRNPAFWVLFVCYGIATGVNSAWSSFLYPNLSKLKEIQVTQMFVGWLGFYSTIAGSISTIVVGFVSDLLPRWKKTFLVICMFVAGVFALLFTLFCSEIIQVGSSTYLVIYLTGIILVLFLRGTISIYYELSAEVGYPIAEATSTIVLTLANNLVGFVFLMLALFPQLGTAWMNWCQTASFFGVVPILVFIPIKYRRLDKDVQAS